MINAYRLGGNTTIEAGRERLMSGKSSSTNYTNSRTVEIDTNNNENHQTSYISQNNVKCASTDNQLPKIVTLNDIKNRESQLCQESANKRRVISNEITKSQTIYSNQALINIDLSQIKPIQLPNNIDEIREKFNRSISDKVTHANKKNLKTTNDIICPGCRKRSTKKALFLDCGHFICKACLKKIRSPNCPTCRQQMSGHHITHKMIRSYTRRYVKDIAKTHGRTTLQYIRDNYPDEFEQLRHHYRVDDEIIEETSNVKAFFDTAREIIKESGYTNEEVINFIKESFRTILASLATAIIGYKIGEATSEATSEDN